jgi:hypothetical protein
MHTWSLSTAALIAALLRASVSSTLPVTEPEDVPPPLQAQILIKTLSYDRALPSRSGQSLGIGLLFGSTKQESARRQFGVRQAFMRAEGTRIQGRPVVVSVHTYKDPAQLAAWIAENKIGAVYITAGLSADIDAIGAVCAQHKVPSLAADRLLVERGVAIGVVWKGTAPSVVVNLSAAEAAGMDLDDRLLRGVEVLNRHP